jgi:hypothetical protein
MDYLCVESWTEGVDPCLGKLDRGGEHVISPYYLPSDKAKELMRCVLGIRLK